MEETFDVAIVGAGPAGISAACLLADQGVKTIVVERGEFPGSKNISGGVLYGHDLSQILPDFPDQNCPSNGTLLNSGSGTYRGMEDTTFLTGIKFLPKSGNKMYLPWAGLNSIDGLQSRRKKEAPWWPAEPWSMTCCGTTKIES